MDARDELELLLSGLLDGPPDPGRDRRLGELLRAHPELHDEYLAHLELHALLRWRGGPAAVPLRRPWRAWASIGAAAALLAIVFGLSLLAPVPDAAGSDVVEQFADWNLDLASAERLADRREIHDRLAPRLKALLAAPLPPADRELARALYDNAAWLARHDDPVAEAARFGELADQVVARMDAAARDRDAGRVASLAGAYRRMEGGLSACLERAARSRQPHHRAKLDRAVAGKKRRAGELQRLMEGSPEPSRKHFRKAIKGHKGKKRPHFRSGE